MSTVELNPENKCSHLMNQPAPAITIEDMFTMQLQLQNFLAAKGKALNYETATFKQKVDNLSVQWRNMTLEFAELLERLPFKEWKTYSPEALENFSDEDLKLEVLYEYIDMFHFFLNMGLCLGIDGETFKKLYYTKNKENFDRQNRGY